MSWLVLALIAPALYAIVIFIDKYVVEHKVKDSRGVPIYGAIASLIFGTLLWLFVGMPLLNLHNTALLMASGVSAIIAASFYFYSLSKSHASYINAGIQLTPIFTFLLAIFVLGEQLTGLQLAGFFAIFAAIIGLSIENDGQKLRLNSAFYSVITASLFFAIASVIIKFTSGINSFVTLVIYEAWGLALGGLILFAVYKPARDAFLQSFRTVGHTTLAVMFGNETLYIISKAITFFAITLGPVTLVGVLGGTQVFYGLIYGVLLTLLFPKLFHENIAKKDIAQKVLLSLVLFAGVLMISV